MSTRRLLASLAATVLVLAGCSSDGGDEAVRTVDETTTTAPSELSPSELVRAAAEAPSEHETVKMEMVVEVDGEQFMRTAGTTSVDNRRGDAVVEANGMEIRMLIVDGQFFYRYPAMPPGYDWVQMSGEEIAATSGVDPTAAAGGADPTQMLEMLTLVSGELEPLGSQELFGVSVEGYRATLSGDAMVKGNVEMGLYTPEMAEQASEMVPESFAMDVWIDGDGLPRRQEWSLEMPAGFGGAMANFEYRMDFPEWGPPLDVSAPNPATVMTMQQYLASMGG